MPLPGCVRVEQHRAVRHVEANDLDAINLPSHAPVTLHPQATVGDGRLPAREPRDVVRLAQKRAADRRGRAATVRVSAGIIQRVRAVAGINQGRARIYQALRHAIHRHVRRVKIVVGQIVIRIARKKLTLPVVK